MTEAETKESKMSSTPSSNFMLTSVTAFKEKRWRKGGVWAEYVLGRQEGYAMKQYTSQIALPFIQL
jgi:hypothetical protein